MESRQPISSLLCLILATVLVSSYFASCQQLSTMFVLETSDSSSGSESSSAASDGKPTTTTGERDDKSLQHHDDTNTRIVTDDGGYNPTHSKAVTPSKATSKPSASHASHNSQSQQHKPQQQQHSDSSSQESDAAATAAATESKNREQKANAARRIEEESQIVSASRQRASTATRSTQQQQQRPNTRDRDRDRDQASEDSTPKAEERLLISITSDEDDDKPPQKHLSGGNGGGGQQNGNSGELLQLPAGQKRKPSITISIQDANGNKQTVGSGSPGTSAVIVRPSENGQSIVISTVGGGGQESNSNKYNQNPSVNKPPAIAIISSSSISNGVNGHHQNNNNNNEPPYREPTEIPVQHVHQQVTSTTYRPPPPASSINNDYNSGHSSNSRPTLSTLIDPPANRPTSSLSEERPHRPLVGADESSSYNYEPAQTSRPTSRPVHRPSPKPVVNQPEPTSDTNDNNYNEDNTPTSSASSRPNQQRPEQGSSEPSRYPLSDKSCGLVHETRIVGGEEADPDDFLWMAAIIKSKPKEGDARPFCGGSLITRRHVLTAAHCLENLAPRDVLVRLGSYDFDDSTAGSLSADYAIDQFRVPAQYSKKTHAADIAIMRLKTPLSTNDNYKTVCMPQPRRSYVGALGTVTGYGSQSQTFRRAAPKLRQVTVPIWENRKCSSVYKKNLTESFLCAGYEEGGKDACQGDSGGPLMTEGPNERMMIVGVVSHGIGCGAPGYPGVYTRTTTYLDWIEKNTRE